MKISKPIKSKMNNKKDDRSEQTIDYECTFCGSDDFVQIMPQTCITGNVMEKIGRAHV